MTRLKRKTKVCHFIHGLSGAGSYLFPTVSSWVENIGGKDCMTLKLRHILEYLTPSFVQSSGVLLKLVIFGKKMANGAGPKYWQDVDSASLKVKFITNFWLTLNLLRCLPLLEEGATPIAKVQALSSGHNSLKWLKDRNNLEDSHCRPIFSRIMPTGRVSGVRRIIQNTDKNPT